MDCSVSVANSHHAGCRV